jgi:xanthine/CO dehydrogenase XdhC/CoxF family maturation factor
MERGLGELPPHGERALSLIAEALSAIAPEERVQFWWRDDDASAGSAALDRLLSISGRYGAPVALAVMPGHLKPSLAETLHGHHVDVLVHGWKHKNQAAPGEPRSEYPLSRPREDMRAEFAKGLSVLSEAFPGQTLAVFVPPWNRLPAQLEESLIACGYFGLAASGAGRRSSNGGSGLQRTGIDLNVVGTNAASHLADVDVAAASLAARIKAGERGPFCIVTHHRQHDDDVWAFCEALWRTLSTTGRVEVLPARAVFRPG